MAIPTILLDGPSDFGTEALTGLPGKRLFDPGPFRVMFRSTGSLLKDWLDGQFEAFKLISLFSMSMIGAVGMLVVKASRIVATAR